MSLLLDTDTWVSLDQILIQLQVLSPDWRRLAVALKIDGIDNIKEFVSILCL